MTFWYYKDIVYLHTEYTQMTTNSNRYGFLSLLVFFVALLGHHFWRHGGHFGFDDMHYARLAKWFADGLFQTTGDHYTFRWGMIIPHGLVYKLMGVGDHSSAVVPLGATMLTLLCVWKLTDALPVPARIWAMAFTAFSEWVFFYSDKLMPDVLVMACLSVAFTIDYRYRFGRGFHRPWQAAAGVSVALAGAFLCKETVVLVLPIWAYLLLRDLFRRQHQPYWRWTLAIGTGLLGAYLAWCWLALGHPLARLQAIAANSYFSPCSYDQLPLENTLRRIGYELWAIFLSTGVLLGLVAILPALGQRKNTGPQRHLLGLGVSMLLLSNFMSTSPTAYVPLCLDIRHYLFAVPFVGAAAAVGFTQWLAQPQYRAGRWRWMMALTTIAAGISWVYQPDGTYVYASLWLVLLLSSQLKSDRLIWALLLLPLLIKPVHVMQKAFKSSYEEQKALVLEQLKAHPVKNTLVISNPVECNIGAYLLEFDSTAVQFMPFNALDSLKIAQVDSLVLIMNGLTVWMSNMGWEDYPRWVREPDSSRHLIQKSEDIEWYGLRKSTVVLEPPASQ